MPNDKPFADMARLREKAGLTLDQVAARAGISLSYLHRIERGYVATIRDKGKLTRLLRVMEQMRKAGA